MMTFNVIIVIVNFLFLLLGGLLYLYAINHGAQYQEIVANGVSKWQLVSEGKNIIGDSLFPTVALKTATQAISIIFIIALISALFPSADGALTALTSSFCIDILGLKRREDLTEQQRKRIRLTVHLSFALLFMLCILVFKWSFVPPTWLDHDFAGYTYGPSLDFCIWNFTKRNYLSPG
jgi:Na+/proline symporter